MIYSITNGKLIPADVPDNHRLNNLPNGTIIKSSGDMANPSTTYIVVGKRESKYGNSYQVIDAESYRETFLDTFLFRGGNRFTVTDEIAGPDAILNAWSMAKIKKAHEEEAKALEIDRRKTLEEKYKKENPHLEVGQYCVVASRNIKRELKLKYPGVKFSVKSKGYSGGDNVSVRWTDGPRVEDVKKITSKYEMGSFDAMTDMYEYDRRNVWTEVFGGTKYLHESRSYSDEHIQKAIDQMGEIDGKKYVISDYKSGAMDYNHRHHLYDILESF